MQGEWDQRDADRGHGARRQPRSALAIRPQEPDRLGHEQEGREVVRAEGERRGERPPAVRAATEEQKRERRHQHEQRVRARLLRVPDEERVERDERRRDQPGARRVEPHARRSPRDGHSQRPEQRRQRPETGLAVAERFLPQPDEHVVERRRGLVARDSRQHVPERSLHEVDRVRLVEPEALVPDAREAQRRRHGDERDQGKALPTPRHAPRC